MTSCDLSLVILATSEREEYPSEAEEKSFSQCNYLYLKYIHAPNPPQTTQEKRKNRNLFLADEQNRFLKSIFWETWSRGGSIDDSAERLHPQPDGPEILRPNCQLTM